MIGAIVILLAGSIAEITSHNWQTWLGGAIIIRMGVGLAQSILVTYISEIAPFQIRGFMIGSYQLQLGIGQLISSGATKILQDTRPDAWKPLIATEFIFTGILALGIPWVPESHLYHARKGNEEKAKASMVKLYGTAKDYDVVSRSNLSGESDFWLKGVGLRVQSRQTGSRRRASFQFSSRRRRLFRYIPRSQLEANACWLHWYHDAALRWSTDRVWLLDRESPCQIYIFRHHDLILGADIAQYFFQVAGLDNPFLGESRSRVLVCIADPLPLVTIITVSHRRSRQIIYKLPLTYLSSSFLSSPLASPWCCVNTSVDDPS